MNIITFKKEKSIIDYEDLIGDIFYWSDWIYDVIDKEKKAKELIDNYDFIRLQNFSELTFGVLKKMNIEYPAFPTYECPFTNIKFLGVLPLIIFSKDINKYRQYFNNDIFADMTFDVKWSKERLSDYETLLDALDADYVGKMIQGHGYTDCTLPSDGFGEWKLFIIRLSNDDLLLVRTYLWFNK